MSYADMEDREIRYSEMRVVRPGRWYGVIVEGFADEGPIDVEEALDLARRAVERWNSGDRSETVSMPPFGRATDGESS